jgi:hypothetical protein
MERKMKTVPIMVESLFPDLNWSDVRIHVAQKSTRGRVPLDVFGRSREEWRDGWNGNYQSRHYWNRTYIFSIIEMKETNCWLFGGVFRVLKARSAPTKAKPGRMKYQLADTEFGSEYVGRMVIDWTKDSRPMGRDPHHPAVLKRMKLSYILRKTYAGEEFPGLSRINHSYSALEAIWKDSPVEWRGPLENCKGVYLITDKNTGSRYVGSATGEDGIWSRWSAYLLGEGHGGNKKIISLLKRSGEDYCRTHFQFALLEYASSRDDSYAVRDRENHWKQVLFTRGEEGLNAN